MTPSSNSSRGPFRIILIILSLILAIVGYWYWSTVKTQPPPLPPPSHQSDMQEKSVPDRTEQTRTVPPGSDLVKTPHEESGQLSPDTDKKPCETVAAQLESLYQRLDKQDYILSHLLQDGSENEINRMLSKLLSTPPSIVNEKTDLFNILNNMTHFFRVIGKKDVLLAKDILLHEEDNIEQILALYYQWFRTGPCQETTAVTQGKTLLPLPLDGLYEYASFFLNTLGGQSYLLRRDIRLRLLIKYYAILILDQAYTEQINRHGIDIRFPIQSLIGEIESVNGLLYSEDYLHILYELQEKYRLHDTIIEPGKKP